MQTYTTLEWRVNNKIKDRERGEEEEAVVERMREVEKSRRNACITVGIMEKRRRER